MKGNFNNIIKLIFPSLASSLLLMNPSHSQSNQNEITFLNNTEYNIVDLKILPHSVENSSSYSTQSVGGIPKNNKTSININTDKGCYFNLRAVFKSGRALRIAEKKGVDFCNSKFYEYK